jgi:adenine phosphoribosyltransferase
VPDFPKPGIFFKDITPVLQDPPLLARCVGEITRAFAGDGFDVVGGIEARGFILGALVAHTAGKPFFPLRKPGKLPWNCLRESYTLEYGEAELEMHTDAFPANGFSSSTICWRPVARRPPRHAWCLAARACSPA